MKTKEELNALKEEVETLNERSAELTDEQLDIVAGGVFIARNDNAAGDGVKSTIDILKTLKEKVINAANDTNTDVDRTAIQKEINASIAQIDDNALTTFNGKVLIDGSQT